MASEDAVHRLFRIQENTCRRWIFRYVSLNKHYPEHQQQTQIWPLLTIKQSPEGDLSNIAHL